MLNGDEFQMGASLSSPMNGCGGAGMKEHLEMEGPRAGATQPDGFSACTVAVQPGQTGATGTTPSPS